MISILAILIGLLLPALGAAKASAQFLRCQTNLRSMGQGILAYAADHQDAKVPIAWAYNPATRKRIASEPAGTHVRDWATFLKKSIPLGMGILIEGDYLDFENVLDPGWNSSEDVARERDRWERNSSVVGSSYLYFYREPVPGESLSGSGLTITPADLINRLTLEYFAKRDQYAMVSCFNMQPNALWSAEFGEASRWVAHPQEERSNVLFLDGSVASGKNGDGTHAEDWIVRDPGNYSEINDWFDRAHELYGGE